MLTVLETLGPAERAVFVLREVFDAPYEEIAAGLVEVLAPDVVMIADGGGVVAAARKPITGACSCRPSSIDHPPVLPRPKRLREDLRLAPP